MKRLAGVLWVAAFTQMLSGCGYFLVMKDQYKATKNIAIVQVIGEPEGDIWKEKPVAGRQTRERILTNDAIALRDFLTSKGHTVLPIAEMVKSEKYTGKGDYRTNLDYWNAQPGVAPWVP